MQRDVRQTALYREAEALYQLLCQPGTGHISDAAELHSSPDGQYAAFSATLVDALEGVPPTRICQTNLVSGDSRILTSGPNTDRCPKYSPDGQWIGFLSDRHRPGDFQLHLLNLGTGATRSTPPVNGWVEYLHWSPDGRRILLAVAGYGADTAGVQGAIPSTRIPDDLPSWTPEVQHAQEERGWRRVWLYELASDCVSPVGPALKNIWEAVWCGNDNLVAVTSTGPGEGLWYEACLNLIPLESGTSQEIYRPEDQLGWPAASPSGTHVAVVEAICSDRWAVAGNLTLLELATGLTWQVDTNGVDITYTEWCSDSVLMLAGHRGFDTVVGTYDLTSGRFTETWASREVTGSGRYISLSRLNVRGDCALIGEGFRREPEVAVICGGQYRTVESFAPGRLSGFTLPLQSTNPITWMAPDGLEIQGWLLRPEGQVPHPLILCIHGGPVAHWRPVWLGRRHAHLLMLLARGYALLLPNPRGSSGRGQDFARRVVGDMGGRDTYDCLSGIDHLAREGIADTARLGVTGVSYGGFMASWLITQDTRFAAAVCVSPVTNWLTEHLLSNLTDWVAGFLADSPRDPQGQYFQRSPVLQAHRARTPTLLICGALDRCTPAEEAAQFHRALLEKGVDSMLLTYPEEGHGIRKRPALIDYAVRIVSWFERHMDPAIQPAEGTYESPATQE
jgi:dipeptidyl aminopeptidase/acylaminoacyl peptidase